MTRDTNIHSQVDSVHIYYGISLSVHLGHILAKIRLKLNNSRPISLSVLLVHDINTVITYVAHGENHFARSVGSWNVCVHVNSHYLGTTARVRAQIIAFLRSVVPCAR